MTFSYIETKDLFDLVLIADISSARDVLRDRLDEMGRSEPEFCAGVIEHYAGLQYTADQWFDFFSKVPNILFRYEHSLLMRLSPKQRELLRFE